MDSDNSLSKCSKKKNQFWDIMIDLYKKTDVDEEKIILAQLIREDININVMIEECFLQKWKNDYSDWILIETTM